MVPRNAIIDYSVGIKGRHLQRDPPKDASRLEVLRAYHNLSPRKRRSILMMSGIANVQKPLLGSSSHEVLCEMHTVVLCEMNTVVASDAHRM